MLHLFLCAHAHSLIHCLPFCPLIAGPPRHAFPPCGRQPRQSSVLSLRFCHFYRLHRRHLLHLEYSATLERLLKQINGTHSVPKVGWNEGAIGEQTNSTLSSQAIEVPPRGIYRMLSRRLELKDTVQGKASVHSVAAGEK